MNTFEQLARGVSIAEAKSIDLRMMSYEYFAVFFAGAAAFGLTAFLGGVRKRGVVAAAMLNVLCGLLYSVAEIAFGEASALSCFVSGYGGIAGQFAFSVVRAVFA